MRPRTRRRCCVRALCVEARRQPPACRFGLQASAAPLWCASSPCSGLASAAPPAHRVRPSVFGARENLTACAHEKFPPREEGVQ